MKNLGSELNLFLHVLIFILSTFNVIDDNKLRTQLLR